MAYSSKLSTQIYKIIEQEKIMISLNTVYRHKFSFSQEDVILFAQVSGDNNPLHLDADFAATTVFKRPIIHGALASSVFSKIMGTEFPGFGSVYMKQVSEYKRPMFVDTEYEAVFTVMSINSDKHSAEISTEIFDVATAKKTTEGMAVIMNKEEF
jgi:acyl dehydratase